MSAHFNLPYFDQIQQSVLLQQIQNPKLTNPQNTISQDQQISILLQKITEREQEYKKMEEFYTCKIKQLQSGLEREDNKYKELFKKMLELKQLTLQHRDRVQQLNLNGDRTERTVKSPQRFACFNPKNILKLPKNIDDSVKNTGIKVHSPSREFRKVPAFHKATLKTNDSIKVKDSSSTDQFSKKSQDRFHPVSPATKQSRNLKNSSPTEVGMKKSKGLGALKQRAPFK